MDKNIKWYIEKRVDRIHHSLLAKQFTVTSVQDIEEAKDKMISLLSSDKSIVLGDTLNFSSDDFTSKLSMINPDIIDIKKRRELLTCDIGIIEGEFVTTKGEIILACDFNVSLGLFGAKTIYIFLNQNAVVDNFPHAVKKIRERNEYYMERSIKIGNHSENLSIGMIENGRKFEDRIHIILYKTDNLEL